MEKNFIELNNYGIPLKKYVHNDEVKETLESIITKPHFGYIIKPDEVFVILKKGNAKKFREYLCILTKENIKPILTNSNDTFKFINKTERDFKGFKNKTNLFFFEKHYFTFEIKTKGTIKISKYFKENTNAIDEWNQLDNYKIQAPLTFLIKGDDDIKLSNRKQMEKKFYKDNDILNIIEKYCDNFFKITYEKKIKEKKFKDFFGITKNLGSYGFIKDYYNSAKIMRDEFEDLFFDEEDFEERIRLKDGTEFLPIKKVLNNHIGNYFEKELINFQPKIVNELEKYITATLHKKSNLRKKHIVAFKNKVINLKTGKIFKLKQEQYLYNIIPHNLITKKEYDERKEERIFIETIYETWFGKNWEDAKNFLHNIIGGIMAKNNDFEKLLIFIGKGGEGKSQYIKRIKKILGKSSVSNESFDNLSNRFAPLSLKNKLLNIDPDLEIKKYTNTSIIKKIATNEDLRGEAKGGSIVQFKNYAFCIIASNEIPTIYEGGNSRAIRRRLSFLKFKKELKMSKKKKENYKLKRFDEKVIETEIYEIAEIYKKYHKRLSDEDLNSFNHEESYKLFLSVNNNVLRFIHNNKKNWENKNVFEIYNSYVLYCANINEDPIQKIYFEDRLNSLLGEQGFEIKKVGGKWVKLEKH